MITYQERCLNTIIWDMEELSCTALSASFKYYTRSEVSNLQDFLSTARELLYVNHKPHEDY